MRKRKRKALIVATVVSSVALGWAVCSCAPELSNIEKFKNQLETRKDTKLTYDQAVAALGEPGVYKEHENEIVASWSRTFSEQANIAQDVGGEKLIMYFDKNTMKLINWDYKRW